MKIFEDNIDGRLFSLDLLRGIDMFLLVAMTPVILGVHASWGLPEVVTRHCMHIWGQITLHDLIMPCFVFMCGAAIPFSLGKRMKDGRPAPGFWSHVLKRFALLYVLGSIVQCNLLTFDPMCIHLFYNTLQVIGVAYVTTALVIQIPSRVVQFLVPILSVVAMGLIVHIFGRGDYSQTGNFSYLFDRMFWGLFLPKEQFTMQPNGYWTYLLPQLGWNALALCGYQCTMLLKSEKGCWAKAGSLAVLSAFLFAAAGISSVFIPIVYQIFTLPFVLYAGGWCVLSLDVLFVVTDIWKFRRGTGLFVLFGRNALAAYMLSEMFGRAYRLAAGYFTCGVPNIFGERAVACVDSVVAVILLVLSLLAWIAWKRCCRSSLADRRPQPRELRHRAG